jgi:membrane-associated HD superfamily phosphohydrolase
VSRIAKCSHGSVHASKVELRKKKELVEQTKMAEASLKIKEDSIEATVERMKENAIPDDKIQQAQQKLEETAKENVQAAMGGAAYETYD